MLDLISDTVTELEKKYAELLVIIPNRNKIMFSHIFNHGIEYIKKTYQSLGIQFKSGAIYLLKKWFEKNEFNDDNQIITLIDEYHMYHIDNYDEFNDNLFLGNVNDNEAEMGFVFKFINSKLNIITDTDSNKIVDGEIY